MQIEVGQVWKIEDRMVMVSSVTSPNHVVVGDAVKRGSSYAIAGKLNLILKSELQMGTFVFDTEAP